MKIRYIKKLIVICIILSMIYTTINNCHLIVASDTTQISDEDVVTDVKNSSNGIIKFKVRVPAGKTANWSVRLKHWDNRNVYIEQKYGTVKNSGKKTQKKEVSVNLNYYSTKYKVFASYKVGIPRIAKVYSDTDNAKSVPQLKKKVMIRDFVWNNKMIKQYNISKCVAKTFMYAGTLAFDIAITKGAATGYITASTAKAISAGASVAEFSYDILSTFTKKEYSTFKKVLNEPVKGWGYKMYAVPCKEGFYYSISVYNDKKKLYKTVKCQKITGSTLAAVIE